MSEEKFLKELVRIRREIHRYPELGSGEFKTAKLIEKVLTSLKISHKRAAKTGVVAVLGNKSASKKTRAPRCIALRADMDALPLTEKTNKPYRSKNPGVMHACGHDAHVSMLLGAAMILSRKKFPGTVKLFFQPNEEGAGGARSLISQGAMRNPVVDAVVGLHVNPRLPTGVVGLKEGPLMAAVDKFTIEVLGAGGHAAYPHEGKDAVLIASEIVGSLQSIASRKIDPLEPVVVTVGMFHSGARYNILAEKAVLTGTVRTLSEKTHRRVPELIRQIADGVTRAHGGSFKLIYERIGSVLSNTPSVVKLSRRVAMNLFGQSKVQELDTASMGGEDFAEYLKISPGCFIYMGTGNKSLRTEIPWHHAQFDLDEKAMPAGAKLLAGITEEFLSGCPE